MDPSAPVELLRQIAVAHPPLRHSIARNPAIPLDLLASFDDERLAPALLDNPAFPLFLLEDPRLSRLSNALRCGLARCPSAPLELLEALLDQSQDWLLLALWDNPALPDELRGRILHVGQPSFRRSLARSGSIPQGYHRLLLSDADPWIRGALGQRCGCCSPWRALLRQARASAEGKGRPLLASQQHELLTGGVWARVLLARQPTLARGVRGALELDPAEQVRRTLARAPSPARASPSGSLRHERRCVGSARLRRELGGPRGGRSALDEPEAPG